jgi:hypothetical protein
LSTENDILEQEENVYGNNVAVSSQKSNIVASIDPTYKYKSNYVEDQNDSIKEKSKSKTSKTNNNLKAKE